MLAVPLDDIKEPDDYNFCFKCGGKIYIIEADEKDTE